MLTTPYVTTTAFRAHPTFLDVMNLRTGDSSALDQDAELNNILLMASADADNYVRMGTTNGAGLGAHSHTQNERLTPNRKGQLVLAAEHHPVSQVTALAWGYQPNALTAVPDLGVIWTENGGRTLVAAVIPIGMQWLQFGAPMTGQELYTAWTYTAGYANTLLAGPVSAGGMSIPVIDPAGIAVGVSLRIWDPGAEEAVIVAPSYLAGSTTVPITTALRFDHTAESPTGVSGLPAEAHLAVILYAAALLQRPDSENEDTFPSTTVRPNTRIGGSHDGTGFVAEAERLLFSYRRIR